MVWWLACRVNRRQIEQCVQPWCNPMWLTGLKIPTNQTMGKFSLGTMQDIKLYKKIIRILMSGGAVKNRILLARAKSAVFYRSHCFLSSAPRQPCLASPESVWTEQCLTWCVLESCPTGHRTFICVRNFQVCGAIVCSGQFSVTKCKHRSCFRAMKTLLPHQSKKNTRRDLRSYPNTGEGKLQTWRGT